MKTFFLLKVLMPLGMLICFGIALNLTGKWEGYFHIPSGGGDVAVSATFVQKDSILTGFITGPDGSLDISNGKVSGDSFSFDVDGTASGTIHNTGKYYGDSITLNFATSGTTIHEMLKRVP